MNYAAADDLQAGVSALHEAGDEGTAGGLAESGDAIIARSSGAMFECKQRESLVVSQRRVARAGARWPAKREKPFEGNGGVGCILLGPDRYLARGFS